MKILSITHSHDSSISLLEDGKLIFYMKEERLSRDKRRWLYFLSIFELHKQMPDLRVDVVLFHKSKNDYKDKIVVGCEKAIAYLTEKLFGAKKFIHYSELNHHLLHANLSFYHSGFDDSLVFVFDSAGSCFYANQQHLASEASSVFHFRGNFKKILYKSFATLNFDVEKSESDKNIRNLLLEYYNENFDLDVGIASLGFIYSSACGLINEIHLEGGKVMGLSSYGEDNCVEMLKSEYPNFDYNLFNTLNYHTKDFKCFPRDLPTTDKVTKDNYQFYANYSKMVQSFTETEALRLIKKYVEKTGIKNVCLSGGYANNIVANAYFKKNLPDVNFYFEPVCDDSGISIGAAYDYYTNLNNENIIVSPSNNFYVSYINEKITDKRAINLSTSDILELFLQQKTIAIFQGQPESGQRALGHRSIIFDARNPNGKDLVNKVKMREWYRPFAGVIKKEDFKDYFFNNGFEESPNMMINFEAKEHTCKEFPSIIHIDNTCRIQTVTEGFFYDFITLLKEKTGCPIILNTSFNLAGEPLVHSVKDAIRTFDSSNLDVLYFVEEEKALLK